MTNVLIASFLLAHQVPASPEVQLPSNWKGDYGAWEGHSYFLMSGPEGEVIRFPTWGVGVEPAAKVHARDPKALFVSAWLGGRSVEAALTTDGTLNVSLGRRIPGQHRSDAPAEFTTQVTTAREAAVALGIVLTRLRAAERDPDFTSHQKRSPDAPASTVRVPGDPFAGSVTLPIGYVYCRGTPVYGFYGRLECLDRPTVSMFHDAGPAELADPVDGKVKPMWYESRNVLGGTLNVWGSDVRSVGVRFDPPTDGSYQNGRVTFVSLEGVPQVAVAAIFAALTYVPPRS